MGFLFSFAVILRWFAFKMYCFWYGNKIKYFIGTKQNKTNLRLLTSSVLPSYDPILGLPVPGHSGPSELLPPVCYKQQGCSAPRAGGSPLLLPPAPSWRGGESTHAKAASTPAFSPTVPQHPALHPHTFTCPALAPSVPTLLTLPQVLGSVISSVNRWERPLSAPLR